MRLSTCALVFQCFMYLADKIYCDLNAIEIIDLTRQTNWKDLSDYYLAVEKRWKICTRCGKPGLGTAIHLEHSSSDESMYPAVIPAEYLLTKLVVVDASDLMDLSDDLVMSLEVALQWPVLKNNPLEPTLLLFNFGWKQNETIKKKCACTVPGLSYELAEWISANLSHVVGVATDAPTLESEQTREFSTRTVSRQLSRSGVYMIENVKIKRRIPDAGCITIAAPLKLLNANFVPTRLTAYCPMSADKQVALTLKNSDEMIFRQIAKTRLYDVNLDEILN